MLNRLLVSLLLYSFLIWFPLHSFSLKYLLTTDSGEKRFMVWDIQKNDGILKMVSYDERGTRTFISDSSGAISLCSYEDFENNIYFQGEMTGSQLTVSRPKGRRLQNRSIGVNDPHWYQPLGFCFFDFARSEETVRDLFTIDPDKLRQVEMTLRKKDMETINVLEEEHLSVKAELRLKGILAPIWCGTYWLCPDSGLLLRYKGTFGPGTEDTLMELIEIQGQVDF